MRGGGLDPGLEAEVGITPLEPIPPGPGLAVGRVRVPVKSAGQQAVLMLHRTRVLLIRQQTMLANAFWAHLAEFGIVVVQGIRHVRELIERVSPRISLIFPPWCVRLFGRSSRS